MPFVDSSLIPSTGNTFIDNGHSKLAEAINKAYDAWLGRASSEILSTALANFLTEIKQHFTQEELLIRAAGYPRWGEHAAQHRRIVYELEQMISQILRTQPVTEDSASEKMRAAVLGPTVIDLFNVIDRLIYEHEILDDQDFEDFLNKRSEKAGHESSGASNDVQPLLEWEDDFSVGDEAVDRQHRTLISLLNRLHGILETTPPDEGDISPEVTNLLKAILDQTRWHFEYEENLMRKLNTYGLESHCVLHQELLADMGRVISDYLNGVYVDLGDLLENYLKYWLLDHIRHMDMRIRQSIQA